MLRRPRRRAGRLLQATTTRRPGHRASQGQTIPQAQARPLSPRRRSRSSAKGRCSHLIGRPGAQGRRRATAGCLVRVRHLCACAILCAISPSFPQPPLRAHAPPRRPWRSAPVLRRVSSPRPERGATPARSPWRSGGRSRPTAARVPTPGGACPPAGSSGGAGALATMPCVFPIRSWRPTPCMPRWQPLSTPYRSCVRLWKLMTVIAWDIVALCVLSYMEGCQHGQ